MRLGIANQETWNFFNEIYTALSDHYETSLLKIRHWNYPIFHTRINTYIFRNDLRSFLRSNDVVFFEWASGLLTAASKMPKSCGIVTRLHRYEMYEWVDKINWNAVDKIILVSHAKKREFIEKYPEQEGKIVISGPSTSLSKFVPKSKVFGGDIGILCNLTPRKRVYDLILAFYELRKTRSDFHLHIAGGSDPAFGDYFTALQYIVRDLHLQNSVTFYGHLDQQQDWYHKIDIFISNSYSEGMQVAPMEAMASGCYVLLHKWDGADEMLPEKYLYYSESELIEKILAYSKQPEEIRQKEKMHMRQIACDKFDINQTIRQIIQTIEDVSVESQRKIR